MLTERTARLQKAYMTQKEAKERFAKMYLGSV